MEKVPRMNDESIRGLLRVLADENERLDAVLDSMMDGIVVCDEQHQPIIVNKAAERLLPLSPIESSDEPFWMRLRDDELAAFFKAALNGEESIIDREFAINAGSSTRILAISVTPLVRERRIRGTLVHVEETTDKRRREARLRRAENLASLTTLAAGVAHEIKNPLGSMSIHVQLLRKLTRKLLGGANTAETFNSGKSTDRTEGLNQTPGSGGESGDSNLERYLDIITEEIDRLNRIVVDFLFAVRPMDLAPINDDPNQLLSEVVEFLRVEVESAGIQLDVSFDRTAPLLPFDRRYMKQALLNLVKNAMAAMPDGGTLSLSTKVANEEIMFTVKDTGIGMNEDVVGKIFEPYFTTKENGTGLGLTLTYKIIKEHGGDISVTSKPGQGSTFSIQLPIPQKDRQLLTGICPDGDCETGFEPVHEEAR